jgi:Fe-S cluster assembly protein SufB
VRYTTVQNWSKNIYNLNTKRAWVERDAQMEWVGGSLGAYITMLYPCSVLRGPNAKASHLNIAFGSKGTWKDGGAKVIHAAPYTQSKVIAKSISMGGGTSVYRGLVRINKGALYAKSHVQCDALMMDDRSRSETYPHNEIYEPTATFSHEASAGKISDTIVYYLMSRGLKEDEARSLIVLGFLDDVLKEIPFEFAIELNRLVRLEMEKLGAVG